MFIVPRANEWRKCGHVGVTGGIRDRISALIALTTSLLRDSVWEVGWSLRSWSDRSWGAAQRSANGIEKLTKNWERWPSPILSKESFHKDVYHLFSHHGAILRLFMLALGPGSWQGPLTPFWRTPQGRPAQLAIPDFRRKVILYGDPKTGWK